MSSRGIRLWPLYLIAAAAILALMVIWLPESLNRQKQVMGTMATSILSVFLSLLWLLLLSRLVWRQRLSYFGGAAVAIGLAVGCLRIDGMSGDFRPILTWRWSDTSAATNVDGGGVTAVDARDWSQFLGFRRERRPRRDPGTARPRGAGRLL
jgi:hypothetical protein